MVDEVLVHVWMARAKVYLLAMDSGHLHMQTITAGLTIPCLSTMGETS